jgi:hypothetical protein
MTINPQSLAESFIQIDMPVSDVVHMDTGYTDAVVDGQGMLLEHWRALPCPVGKGDPFDMRKMHADHSGCSNGYIYEQGGDITALFVGNSKQLQALDVGFVTGSTVQITVPRFYTNDRTREVVISVLDRLYLKQTTNQEHPINVIAAQLFEHNTSGMDRVKYPINAVELIVDSHGKRYYQGDDFDVSNGQIAWRGTKQPGMDPETGKGEVCSIRYRYTPYWYVSNLMHEIRVVRSGFGTERTPMTALLQREYAFENEQNDQGQRPGSSPLANNSQRQAMAPRSGSFGPR